jgi:hypothetical protein
MPEYQGMGLIEISAIFNPMNLKERRKFSIFISLNIVLSGNFFNDIFVNEREQTRLSLEKVYKNCIIR